MPESVNSCIQQIPFEYLQYAKHLGAAEISIPSSLNPEVFGDIPNFEDFPSINPFPNLYLLLICFSCACVFATVGAAGGNGILTPTGELSGRGKHSRPWVSCCEEI